MAKLGKQNLSIAHQRQKYVSKLTTRSNLSYPTFNISQFSRFSWFNGPMFGSPKQLNLNVFAHFMREIPHSNPPPKKMEEKLAKNSGNAIFPLDLPNSVWDSRTDSWICCKEGPPLGGGAAGAALGAAGAGAMAIGWPAWWMGWGGWIFFFFPCSFGLFQIHSSPFWKK